MRISRPGRAVTPRLVCCTAGIPLDLAGGVSIGFYGLTGARPAGHGSCRSTITDLPPAHRRRRRRNHRRPSSRRHPEVRGQLPGSARRNNGQYTRWGCQQDVPNRWRTATDHPGRVPREVRLRPTTCKGATTTRSTLGKILVEDALRPGVPRGCAGPAATWAARPSITSGPLIVAQKGRPVRGQVNQQPAHGAGRQPLPPGGCVGDGLRARVERRRHPGFQRAERPAQGRPRRPATRRCYTQNRATIHLHGGVTPWISDGTTHQWITPAGESTPYPDGRQRLQRAGHGGPGRARRRPATRWRAACRPSTTPTTRAPG